MPSSFRPLIISVLARWKGISQKEIAASLGMRPWKVSYYLNRKDLDDDVYDRLLQGVRAEPAEVILLTHCLESLEALERNEAGLTPQELCAIEEGVLEATRLLRGVLIEIVRRSRGVSVLMTPSTWPRSPARAPLARPKAPTFSPACGDGWSHWAGPS